MDLVRENKPVTFGKKNKELQVASGDTDITVFGTSIYDESLYKVRSCPLFLASPRLSPHV